MNAAYIVRLEGFHSKAALDVEKMLRDDIATYPSRVSGLTATVELVSEPEHKPVTVEAARAAVRATGRRGEGHAKS